MTLNSSANCVDEHDKADYKHDVKWSSGSKMILTLQSSWVSTGTDSRSGPYEMQSGSWKRMLEKHSSFTSS